MLLGNMETEGMAHMSTWRRRQPRKMHTAGEARKRNKAVKSGASCMEASWASEEALLRWGEWLPSLCTAAKGEEVISGVFSPYHSPLIQVPPMSFDFEFLPLACIRPQCTHITYPTLGQVTCKYMAAIVLWQSVVPLTRTGATVWLKCAINWHLWQWRPSVLLEKGADVWDIQGVCADVCTLDHCTAM